MKTFKGYNLSVDCLLVQIHLTYCLLFLQMIKYWEAFLPEAKAIA